MDLMKPNIVDDLEDDLASISNSSYYFESNCELYYIENGMEKHMKKEKMKELERLFVTKNYYQRVVYCVNVLICHI